MGKFETDPLYGESDKARADRYALIIRGATKALQDGERGTALKLLRTAFPNESGSVARSGGLGAA